MERKNEKLHVLPSVLAVLGGFFILADGIYALYAAPYIYSSTSFSTYLISGLGTRLAPFSIVLGLMIIGSGLLIYNKNKVWSTMWSSTVLVFSIMSILSGGGFIIGLLLSFVGAILGIFYSSSRL